ncbi:hypothetical protein FACS1894122_03150 [Alphaproteobacteria bacterium]|nr:hypothetical protein FACS1894122_03150 [Alphaproteobacteria bacterium]
MKIVVFGVCLASFVLCNCVIALPFKTIIYREAVPKKSIDKSQDDKDDPDHKKDKREAEEDTDKSQDDKDDPDHKKDKREGEDDADQSQEEKDDTDHKKDEREDEDDANQLQNDEDDESSTEKTEAELPKADPKKLLEGFYVSLGVGCDMSKSNVTTESQEATPVIKPTLAVGDTKAEDKKSKNKDKSEEGKEDEEIKKEDIKEEAEKNFINEYKNFFKNPNENEGWRLKNNYFSIRNDEAIFKLSANKKAKIADFSKTLPIISVTVGYGKFLSNESYDNFYLGGEFFVDLGKTTKKEKCFQNWEQELIRFGEESPSFGTSRPERNPEENYDNCALSDTLKKNGVSYGFSLRGGYYVKSIAAMIYLKLGMANVKAEVDSRTSYHNVASYLNSTKVSKFVPEFTIGMEKIVWRTVSIRAEFGYRLNADMHGQLDSQCYLPDPIVSWHRYSCKSKIKLETGGRVARISASWHVP